MNLQAILELKTMTESYLSIILERFLPMVYVGALMFLSSVVIKVFIKH